MTYLELLRPPAGLRALITGGAAGLGRMMASGFVEAGARVHVCDTDAAAVDRARTDGLTASVTDVSDPAAVDALRVDVETELGGLDVLVNGAGIAGPTTGVEDIDDADWDTTIAVNLNAQHYVARRFVPLLKESRGSIIAMSSVAGRLGYAYRTPYAASKWAIVGLVKSLAIELGPHGIRVNAIQPGIVEGPRIQRVISARAEQLGLSYEAMEAEYLDKISLKRMTKPEEITAAAMFLCSPGGSGISGQAISVCGNVEVL
jgi:NAD(P)-dependent dehydrogenase (short-subunit alcohol dehydrogenase family)